MKSKIVSLQKLQASLRRLKAKRKRVVFTNGTYDILHLGHVRYLQKARKLGDVLIVAVNSDASVKSYKDPSRPVNAEKDRLEVIAALGCVDYAILFTDPTPLRLIRALRPDVLVKGADWKKQDVAGAADVESWGGKVRRVTLLKGRSTSRMIEKIVKGCR